MNKLDQYISGLFRRGLPEGEQFDLLATWVVLKITEGQPGRKGAWTALSEAIERGTDHLSKLTKR